MDGFGEGAWGDGLGFGGHCLIQGGVYNLGSFEMMSRWGGCFDLIYLSIFLSCLQVFEPTVSSPVGETQLSCSLR